MRYIWHHTHALWHQITVFMTSKLLYITSPLLYLTAHPLYLCHHTQIIDHITFIVCISQPQYVWHHINFIWHHIHSLWYHTTLWHHIHCILLLCLMVEKGMANHYSIFALRIPWAVWKAKDMILKDELPRSVVAQSATGEITPERMKRLCQSRNNAQFWMWLVVGVTSDVIKNSIA